jgi:hypothetical protein
MAGEIVSTARPSKLRLAGFLALTLGGLLVSLGSLMDWAAVQPFDTPARGVDLWEGTITLAIGFAVLVGMILMRLVRRARARQAVAVAILGLGLIATALAGSAAIRANDRFTSPSQRDRIARALAIELGLPYEEVRARIEATFSGRSASRCARGSFSSSPEEPSSPWEARSAWPGRFGPRPRASRTR